MPSAGTTRCPSAAWSTAPGSRPYAAFGLSKVSLRALLGPSIREALKTSLRRRKEIHRPASGDPFQMCGTFVLDKDATVRMAHRSRDPGDYPADSAVLACLDALPRDAGLT